MSNFACPKCGVVLYDSPRGYVTGCEHYPADAIAAECTSNGLSSRTARGRAGGSATSGHAVVMRYHLEDKTAPQSKALNVVFESH